MPLPNIKSFFATGVRAPVYFWRDHSGTEVDLIIEKGEQLTAIEIKSSATFHADFFKGLMTWQKITKQPATYCQVIYGGQQTMTFKEMSLTAWNDL